MIYSDFVLQLFFNPRHVYDPAESITADSMLQGKAACADDEESVQLFVWLKKEEGRARVVAARFLAKGSVALIAAAEYWCARVEGEFFDQIQNITCEQVMRELALPPLRFHSVLLIFQILLR